MALFLNIRHPNTNLQYKADTAAEVRILTSEDGDSSELVILNEHRIELIFSKKNESYFLDNLAVFQAGGVQYKIKLSKSNTQYSVVLNDSTQSSSGTYFRSTQYVGILIICIKKVDIRSSLILSNNIGESINSNNLITIDNINSQTSNSIINFKYISENRDIMFGYLTYEHFASYAFEKKDEYLLNILKELSKSNIDGQFYSELKNSLLSLKNFKVLTNKEYYIELKDENEDALYLFDNKKKNKKSISLQSDGSFTFNLLDFIKEILPLDIKTIGKPKELKFYFVIDEVYTDTYSAEFSNYKRIILLNDKKNTINNKKSILVIRLNTLPLYTINQINENYNFYHADIEKLVENKINTLDNYNLLNTSFNKIIEENVKIINKIENIIPKYILNNKITYNINNLYSTDIMLYADNTSQQNNHNEEEKYNGYYFYDYRKKTFFTGKDQNDVVEKKVLKYDSSLQNMVFDLNKENSTILLNISNFKIGYSSIVNQLNSKISYIVGMKKALTEFYKNFKDLIRDNLKYFKNYTEVKKMSASSQVKLLNFQKIYLEVLESLLSVYVENDMKTSIFFDTALGLGMSGGSVEYRELSNMVASKVSLNAVSDKNYPIVKAFANINKTLLAFLEDFENINSKLNSNGYNNFLLVALELDIDSLLIETYDGVQLLEEKLTEYLINILYPTAFNLKVPGDINIINNDLKVFNKSNNNKLAIQNFLSSITKLLVVIKELQIIFRINKYFNIFLDFDIKKDNNTHSLAALYKDKKGTNVNISNTVFKLSNIMENEPSVISSRLVSISRLGTGKNIKVWVPSGKWKITPGNGGLKVFNVSFVLRIPRSDVHDIKVSKITCSVENPISVPTLNPQLNQSDSDSNVRLYGRDTLDVNNQSIGWESKQMKLDWQSNLLVKTIIDFEWKNYAGVPMTRKHTFTQLT